MTSMKKLWNNIIGNKSNDTYAEAVSSLVRVENAITSISVSITNIDSKDFKVKKNQWVDLPSDISQGVSVMGLHIDSDYTSLLGYYTPNAFVRQHQHKHEWEIIKILEGSAYDKTNDILLTKGDVYIIPRNKIHNIVTLDQECYLYALFTADKKYLKIPHTESDAAAKRFIHDIKDEELKDINVLYIDNEKQNLDSFIATYRRENFNIYTAESLEKAGIILKDINIHVLLCDYRLPGTTGTEIIKEIRSEYPNIVPVAITAFYDEHIINELKYIAGVNTCISKPWDYGEILNAVKYSYHIYKKTSKEN